MERRDRLRGTLRLRSFVPPGFLRDYDRGRETFSARWESRWGPEAARSIYRFRVFYMLGWGIMMATAAVGVLLAFARVPDALYVAVAAVGSASGLPLMYASIRPLSEGLSIIKAGYEVDSRTRIPFSALSRIEDFDGWALLNRRDSPRAPLGAVPLGLGIPLAPSPVWTAWERSLSFEDAPRGPGSALGGPGQPEPSMAAPEPGEAGRWPSWYFRRRESYVARWESRWGVEDARWIWQARVLCVGGFLLGAVVIVGAGVLASAGVGGPGFAVYCILGAAASAAVLLGSVVPLSMAVDDLKARYGSGEWSAPFRALSSTEEWDTWLADVRASRGGGQGG
ncbi:hypothetical protein [Sinomonas sp. G460-2]|uniref:hypothetical protein n=1 Tax=Sinomonas sp. G460-2 TaxID=3393464 RepID=UPI0039EF14D9